PEGTDAQPVFLEPNLVAHCGGSMGGAFLYTLARDCCKFVIRNARAQSLYCGDLITPGRPEPRMHFAMGVLLLVVVGIPIMLLVHADKQRRIEWRKAHGRKL